MLLAFVALAEGGVALMVAPAVDRVLNPTAVGSMLALVKLPWSGRTIYLNDFFPPRIHNVWTVFAFTLLSFLFLQSDRRIFRQHRNSVRGPSRRHRSAQSGLRPLIRQPMGFFQHNPTGRLHIHGNQRRRACQGRPQRIPRRSFPKRFYAFWFSLPCCWSSNWRMALGTAILLPLVILPVSKFGRKIRRSVENSQSRLGDLSQILQETISGNRVVKAFGMEDFEIRKFREAAAPICSAKTCAGCAPR